MKIRTLATDEAPQLQVTLCSINLCIKNKFIKHNVTFIQTLYAGWGGAPELMGNELSENHISNNNLVTYNNG